eukprot:319727-Pyramimonas_sp.AAC.1
MRRRAGIAGAACDGLESLEAGGRPRLPPPSAAVVDLFVLSRACPSSTGGRFKNSQIIIWGRFFTAFEHSLENVW